MPIENLISLQGPLVETFSQLEPETIQHADEITNERRTNKELRNQWLRTADGAVYTVESDSCQHCGGGQVDDVFFYLTRGQDNPIFKDVKEATKQLIEIGNYEVTQENLETVVDSGSTLKTRLSDLDLQKYGDEYACFEISTKRYDKLNPEQRKVAERVYGQGNDFIENMEMLKKADISKIRVYVLNPEYVEKHTEKGSGIARACWLYNFDVGSSFGAGDGGVDDPGDHLRGVPKEPEGRDVQKGNIVTPSFEEVAAYSAHFVPDVCKEDFETGLQKLYKK